VGLVSVVIDQREPEWLRGLSFGGVPTSVELVEGADLLAICDDGAMIAVERKTAGDLLNSLKDDRLFPQISRLRTLTPWAYLVITGKLQPGQDGRCWADMRETLWKYWSVEAALLTVQETGVGVVRVGAETDYEQTVIRLASRDRSDIRSRPARDLTLAGDGEIILAGLPGIGPDRAKALLEYCGTPAWALTHLTGEQTLNDRVPGIGEATKRRVRTALGLDDATELSVVTREGCPVPMTQREEVNA
jgi:ERCC4-type nuclease